MRRPGIWVANGSPTDASKMLSWRPGALTSFFDYLGPNRVLQYKEKYPDAPVIVRFQHPRNWHEDVAVSARHVADLVISKWPDLCVIDPYVYFCNELNLHYENGDANPGNQWRYETREFYRQYADWARDVADRIKQRVPEMRLVCPPFAYGHHEDGAPDDSGNPMDGWAGYDYLADTIRTHFNNIITFHAYWGDAAGSIGSRLYDREIASWHAFRWRRVLQLFKVRYGIDAKVIIDEAGNFGAADHDFTDQVIYYSRKTLEDERVIALTFFLWQDPTQSPGNILNSWWDRCQNLDQHIARLAALEDITPTVTIRVYAGGVVHTLPLEEYLRDVVPAEMPASWAMEALRAQAVWARSYALWRIANPRHASFDLYATANDQVWNPMMRHSRSDIAVSETRGVYLVQDGKPFAARYVSRCGRPDCPDCQGAGGYNNETWHGRACQYGARAMANAGRTWRDIATAYYPAGVTLSDEQPEVPSVDGGTMKIYDVLGNEKTPAWLATEWGVEVDTSLRHAGGDNFECVELREIEGPAVYRVRVLDRDGQPWSGRFVARYYPSAPNSWPGGSKPDDIPAPPEAATRVVFGQTNTAGVCEFGLGGGDYAGPGQGASHVWLAEHYAGTDVVRRLGMKPNTNHRTISPTFRFVPAGITPPPPTPGGNGCLVAVLEALLRAAKGA